MIQQVTLEVKGETQLKNLAEKLEAASIQHKLWIEQPENIPTCLATRPYPKSKVASFFKKLKLCKWFEIILCFLDSILILVLDNSLSFSVISRLIAQLLPCWHIQGRIARINWWIDFFFLTSIHYFSQNSFYCNFFLSIGTVSIWNS